MVEPRIGDAALAASAAGLALHAVVLDDFKSYSGCVVAEFNSRGIIAIVGPNGAGKSCLVEGICFALGLDLRSMRAQNLKALVNRTGRDDGVACAVSCVFRARSGAGALCVQRRAIAPADGPARSEFRVQGCSCGGLGPGVEHDQLPWPCDQCEVRVARRSELKALLLRSLQLDVDRPDTFVVQQSACASIAQQTPPELLCFIEDFARTAHLRRGVEAEAATVGRLRASLAALGASLSRACAERTRRSPALDAAEELEACRLRLEAAKGAHLRLEIHHLSRAVARHEQAEAALHTALEAARGALQASRAREKEAAEAAEAAAEAAGRPARTAAFEPRR